MIPDPTMQAGLSLLEAAIKAVPSLAGIVERGLHDEPDRDLASLVRERLSESGESAQAAAELRAKQGGP